MATHRPPRPSRPTPPTDPSLSRLFKKPVTDWYKEWKANREGTPSTVRQEPREEKSATQ